MSAYSPEDGNPLVDDMSNFEFSEKSIRLGLCIDIMFSVLPFLEVTDFVIMNK